ncbi:MAG TPA: histidine kinase, partial [Sinorhizobium sp.]|nr:histidine kinase [Sinorhizobium sp.]
MVEASDKNQRDIAAGGLQAVAAYIRQYLRRPFSFYLVWLLLIAIVPPFIFSLVILKRNMDAQQQVVTSLLKASTGSVTRIVER